MDKSFILAIDQGTTNSKAILVDGQGWIAGSASRSPGISYPQPAWVEQDPVELWATVQQVIDACMQVARGRKIAALAVTNQRETVLAWERRTSLPLGPAVVWQCHRSADFCRQLTQKGLEPYLRERTGLTVDPMFSGSKMRWLLDHIENGQRRAEAGEICLGTVDSWVLWNLTGGACFACDYTNASRTQLFNLHSLDWDDEILEIFAIPRPALPEPHLSSGVFGETVPTGDLPGGLPIASLIGDSHAALFGHAGFQPGAIKATYGTGTSLMTPTSGLVLSKSGLSSTIAWSRVGVTYALEGNIYSTGAAVQWLEQVLGMDGSGRDLEELASRVKETGGVYLVPAFVGLGAPYWNETARGLITGLTRGTTAAHLARATLESIAYQVRDVFDLMSAEAGVQLKILLADGGASRNNQVMQFQADILDLPVVRSLSADVSALGAAYLAGLTIGLWGSEAEIQDLPRPSERFEPRMPAPEREGLYAGWQAAVRRTVLDTKPEAETSDGAGHDV
jgi:glycerol kinase